MSDDTYVGINSCVATTTDENDDGVGQCVKLRGWVCFLRGFGWLPACFFFHHPPFDTGVPDIQAGDGAAAFDAPFWEKQAEGGGAGGGRWRRRHGRVRVCACASRPLVPLSCFFFDSGGRPVGCGWVVAWQRDEGGGDAVAFISLPLPVLFLGEGSVRAGRREEGVDALWRLCLSHTRPWGVLSPPLLFPPVFLTMSDK